MCVAIPAQEKQPTWALLLFTTMAATLGIVGALIVTRQPRNTVGWILWVTAVATFVSTMSSAYANFAVTPEGSGLPGATLVAWLAPIGFFPSLTAIVTFIPLLFPDGRYLSRRWRWVGVGGVVVVGLGLAGSLFAPGPLQDYPTIVNPVGLAPVGAIRWLVDGANAVGFLLLAILAIGSAFVRYRRGRGVERTQLRWFGAAAGVTVSLLVLTVILQTAGLSDEAWGLAFLGAIISLTLIPVAIGVAILRYRLYEIDRLISRTIGWALVTGVLLGVFAAWSCAADRVRPVADESSLAVAASTLVAFALFQPVRRRVQRAVDRRFDRARYDGEQTTQAFARLVREQVEIDALARDLRAAVDGSLSPDGLALWLRTVHPSPIPPRS